MADDHHLFPPDAPTRSIGPTMSADATGFDPNAPPLLRNGQEFGPYLIVRMLGRGGMGEVYEAEDRDNARRVALKVLSRGLATAADRARFIREGRLAAGISHPNTVYVYGTDDIEGVPVIAMELAPGGTLKDLVKAYGQLSPQQAVDSILQVIAGLDAAADAGVLHRDIKPSNCFIDSDGTVKVGDFGLSISTQTFDERSLTMLGTVLGTPGFSSPEQLKGDELDVRSDIYSVGATLYYLVTGKAPFEDGNVIKLVTRVAQEMPPSPRVSRPDVPDELAGVIMQCLAKRPEDRFADYDQLRAALQPFSSSAPVPGPLGPRFVAGLVDNLIVTLASAPLMARWWDSFATGDRPGMLMGSMVGWLAVLLYYGIAEGWWGRSLGKQLFSLRVVDVSNQRPGLVRGFLRAGAWILVTSVPVLAYSFAIAPWLDDGQHTLGAFLGFSISIVSFITIAVTFAPARRVNGFAAIHDRLSRTRVIHKREAASRRRGTAAAATPLPVSRRERLGPYVILDERPLGSDDVVAGYDDRLRRKVWLQMSAVGAPPVPTDRRTIARPTRLRWLGGRRTETESWDAYEALDGAALVTLPVPHPWADVRIWLLDLASEIRAAEAEGRVPPLTLGRVWIAGNGRARLLDWEHASGTDSTPLAPQAFLNAVALRALGGDRGLHGPLPLHARAVMEKLGGGTFENTGAVVQDLTALADEPAGLRRGRRIAHLMVSTLPAAFAGLLMLATSVFMIWAQAAGTPANDLSEVLMRIDLLERSPTIPNAAAEREALEIHAAANYAELIGDSRTWTEGWSIIRFNPRLREVANRVVRDHPAPTAEQRAAAAQVAEPFILKERAKAQRAVSLKGMISIVMIFTAVASVFMAILGVLSALLFRGGLMLRLFGIAVSTASGEAGRLRAGWRAVIAWSPAVLAAIALWISDSPITTWDWLIVESISAALFFAGFIYAARNPDRGLQDRLAGTWLVPR